MPVTFDRANTFGYNGGGTSSRSGSLTTVGTDLIAYIAALANHNTDDLVSLTYDGVDITATLHDQAAITIDGIIRQVYLFQYINPPVGTKTITITCSGVHGIWGGAVAYAGALQTGQPDNYARTSSPTSTSFSSSLTPVADGCWIGCLNIGRDGSPPGAGANTTKRTEDANFGVWGFFDNNADISPAALTTLTTTRNNNNNTSTHFTYTIAPAAFVGGGGGSVIFDRYYRNRRNA